MRNAQGACAETKNGPSRIVRTNRMQRRLVTILAAASEALPRLHSITHRDEQWDQARLASI